MKFKMVVYTEILLQAWRERWTPLQWLVEVKKLAGKNKGDLKDLAGDYLEKKMYLESFTCSNKRCQLSLFTAVRNSLKIHLHCTAMIEICTYCYTFHLMLKPKFNNKSRQISPSC